MAKINKKEVYRVTLDFSKESQEYIEELRELFNCSTKAEVFKHALNALDFLGRESEKGWQVILEKDGVRRDVILPVRIMKKPQRTTKKAVV